MSTDELRPCPFCGGPARKIIRHKRIPFVECEKCVVEQSGTTEAEAIAAWNTRASSTNAELLEALEWYAEQAAIQSLEAENRRLRSLVFRATQGLVPDRCISWHKDARQALEADNAGN